MHEPAVECIAKGKAGKPYEFGNKVSVAVSSRGGWFVGAKSFTGNPYDGHTLAAQMKQVESMIGDSVGEVHVDMGYRGHDYEGAAKVHIDKRQRGRTPRALWRWMKRRAAVEPSIGHLKNEHRLERNRLKGIAGDAINADPGGRRHELPEAPRSFLAHFSELPAALLQLHLRPARPPSPTSAISRLDENHFFRIDPFAEEASERTAGLIGGAAKKRQGLIYHLREVGSILAACGVPETDDKELFAKLRAVRTRSQAIICQITQITAGVWEEG